MKLGAILITVCVLGLSTWLSACDSDSSSDGSNRADGSAEDGGNSNMDSGASSDAGVMPHGDAGPDESDAAGGTDGADTDVDASSTDAGDDAGGHEPVEPVILVPSLHIHALSSPPWLLVDDESVYWTSSWVGPNPPTPLPPTTGSYVLKVPKDGGEVTVLHEESQGLGTAIAMDATSIYVCASIDIYNSRILKVAKDGSGAELLTQVPGLNLKANLMIEGQYLYFEGSNPGDIDRVPLGGGAIEIVIDEDTTPHPDGFASFPGVNGMASDGTSLFYSGNEEGMFQVPLAGGMPFLLHTRNMDGARVSNFHSWPAVEDGVVYWHHYGYIYSVPVGGGSVTTVVEPGDGDGSSSYSYRAIDGGYFYYINGGLKKVALDGSDRVTLLDGSASYNVEGIAIDDTSVYMFAFGAQGIIKVPK